MPVGGSTRQFASKPAQKIRTPMARQGCIFMRVIPALAQGIGVTADQLSAFMTNYRVDWVQEEIAGTSIAL